MPSQAILQQRTLPRLAARRRRWSDAWPPALMVTILIGGSIKITMIGLKRLLTSAYCQWTDGKTNETFWLNQLPISNWSQSYHNITFCFIQSVFPETNSSNDELLVCFAIFLFVFEIVFRQCDCRVGRSTLGWCYHLMWPTDLSLDDSVILFVDYVTSCLVILLCSHAHNLYRSAKVHNQLICSSFPLTSEVFLLLFVTEPNRWLNFI